MGNFALNGLWGRLTAGGDIVDSMSSFRAVEPKGGGSGGWRGTAEPPGIPKIAKMIRIRPTCSRSDNRDLPNVVSDS